MSNQLSKLFPHLTLLCQSDYLPYTFLSVAVFFFFTSFSFSHSNASAWADLGVKSCTEVRAADFKSQPHMDLEPVFTSDNPKASTYTISSAGVETSAGQGGLLIYTYT